MRPVLFYIPIKAIADFLPAMPIFIPAAILFIGIMVGRLRKLGRVYFNLVWTVTGISAGMFVLKYLPDSEWIKRLTGQPHGVERIPVYGYGAMLFLAFLFCTWLVSRLAVREGIDPKLIPDLALWIFVGGIVGARVLHMIQFWDHYDSLVDFFFIWKGGLIFYGSALGGAAGYFAAYFAFLRKRGVSNWKMADIIAPAAALGLCIGRVGCLLNGCCYGNVSCPTCPAISFPMSSPAGDMVMKRDYQSPAGFLLRRPESPTAGGARNITFFTEVWKVERGSAAEQAGLRAGDHILKINGKAVAEVRMDRKKDATLDEEEWVMMVFYEDSSVEPQSLFSLLQTGFLLTVRHADGQVAELPLFIPRTVPLHPTQIYETISTGLLCFLLLSFYPFKRHDGSVMVLFMLGYSVHRFLDEMLRTDTPPVFLGMTLSENGSILVFIAACILGLWLHFRAARPTAVTPPAVPVGSV
jgi:phosphatidylglycerol---prolipoprotein diacylglyceryl transferase